MNRPPRSGPYSPWRGGEGRAAPDTGRDARPPARDGGRDAPTGAGAGPRPPWPGGTGAGAPRAPGGADARGHRGDRPGGARDGHPGDHPGGHREGPAGGHRGGHRAEHRADRPRPGGDAIRDPRRDPRPYDAGASHRHPYSARGGDAHRHGPPPAAPSAPRDAWQGDGTGAPAAPGRREELRVYGLNAVRALFARRPQAIRKVYLAEARIPALQPLLKWCVAQRVGYRVVEEGDLQKLAASAHHEGVVADVLREEPMPLSTWLRDLPEGPACALWLDGVGNPHNFGAILRSAAHFGVGAILLPKDSTLALSGAAARVAEGGAEAVPLVRLGRADNSLAQLRGAGFALAATVVEGGEDVFAAALPTRLVYVMGAEGQGMDRSFADACDLRLSIPGTGAVESLNVAAATAVLLAAWARAARG